jgi:uroporphyrinogen-III synthase
MDAGACHVLITRPDSQHHSLLRSLEQDGYRVSHQPALAIEPIPVDAAMRRLLLDIDQYHAVFFASVNAARLALEALDPLWPQWPVGVHWVAVGPATADVLLGAGLPVEMPAAGFDSESVLMLPCLQQVAGQRVLILSGRGGRQHLAEVLTARDALVEKLALYQRACAADFHWPRQPVDVVMVTSLQGWECMADRVPDDCAVVVASQRIAERLPARAGKVLVADSATDEDMMAALRRWRAGGG